MRIVRNGQDEDRPDFPVSLRPVCCHCNREMIALETGAMLHLENSGAYIACDQYGCTECDAVIAVGFAENAAFYKNPPKHTVATIKL